MSNNIILILMYHHHKFLDLKYQYEAALYVVFSTLTLLLISQFQIQPSGLAMHNHSYI
jgi:hypothetical protein